MESYTLPSYSSRNTQKKSVTGLGPESGSETLKRLSGTSPTSLRPCHLALINKSVNTIAVRNERQIKIHLAVNAETKAGQWFSLGFLGVFRMF